MQIDRSICPDDDVVRPLMAVKIINATRHQEKIVYAMLVSGSDRNIILKELATNMELTQRKKSVTI